MDEDFPPEAVCTVPSSAVSVSQQGWSFQVSTSVISQLMFFDSVLSMCDPSKHQ